MSGYVTLNLLTLKSPILDIQNTKETHTFQTVGKSEATLLRQAGHFRGKTRGGTGWVRAKNKNAHVPSSCR